MTKQELYTKMQEVLTKHKVAEGARKEILALVEPRKSGVRVNLDEITKYDANGNLVAIKDRISGLWFPATLEYFHKDTKSDRLKNAKGEQLYPVCKEAEKIVKAAKKAYEASKQAIMQDVLDGVISPEQGKAELAKLKIEPDFSVLKDKVYKG